MDEPISEAAKCPKKCLFTPRRWVHAGMKVHKKTTVKEKATEALCSLMARFELHENGIDIEALKEVATE
ncbi:unnamed protein product, partial [Prorocentrum cordatum]